jgi:tripartite-type tricarboxylate transporter receptor subunit TctC
MVRHAPHERLVFAKQVEGSKRFERSVAVERLERFEPLAERKGGFDMEFNGLRIRLAANAVLVASVFLLSDSAFSQTPFYQGKTLTIVQGTEAGGSSDMMTKAMLPYLKKHIPGEPTVVSEYMPGGGGIKAANHVYKNARPDGLTIGRVGGGLVANAVLGEPGVLYDLNKLIYLGSPHSTYHWVFITRREANLKSIEALRSTPGIRVGAQAVGHSNYFVGRLFAYLIGFKDPKYVVGYGGTELDLALIRGELDGRINNADTLLTRNADLIAKKAIDIHVIMEVPKGLKQAGFDRLPEIEEFAKSERERKLLAMIRTFRQIGTPSILPPGTPPEQVKILRQAMAKMFSDPEFHKEYKKLVGEEPTPLLAEDMERAIKDLPRDPEIIDLFKKLNAAGAMPAR